MRSIVILAVAGAALAAYILVTHYRAGRLFDRENAALARIPELVRVPETKPREEGGYRFEWIEGDDLPPLFVARPLAHGRDGVRWFATLDGDTIYQFDTIVHRARENRPDVAPLRYYVSLPADERKQPPFGWQAIP